MLLRKSLTLICLIFCLCFLSFNNCGKFVASESLELVSGVASKTTLGRDQSIDISTGEMIDVGGPAIEDTAFPPICWQQRMINNTSHDVVMVSASPYTTYVGPSYSADVCYWLNNSPESGYMHTDTCVYSGAKDLPYIDYASSGRGLLIHAGERIDYQGTPFWQINRADRSEVRTTIRYEDTDRFIPMRYWRYPAWDSGYMVKGSLTIPAGCDESCTGVQNPTNVMDHQDDLRNRNRWYKSEKETFIRGLQIFASTGGSSDKLLSFGGCIRVVQEGGTPLRDPLCFKISDYGFGPNSLTKTFGSANGFIPMDLHIPAGAIVGMDITLENASLGEQGMDGAYYVFYDTRDISQIPESQKRDVYPASGFGINSVPTTSSAPTAAVETNPILCLFFPALCVTTTTTTITPPTTSTSCDPSSQPAPHWGMKNGVCRISCGGLGGTNAFDDPCSNHGMSDVGIAYDVNYCCKAGQAATSSAPSSSSSCDPSSQPAPHWGMKNGVCRISCGGLGGTNSFTDPCSNHSMSDAGIAYDAVYCCKPGASTGSSSSSASAPLDPFTCFFFPALCMQTVIDTSSNAGASCDPGSQPAPHWGMKDGVCRISCGGLGGTNAFADPCSNHGMSDAGIAYDVQYCCK